MEKRVNIFEVLFEGLANVMAKQEAIGDAIFNGLCKKCGEHKEYMMVGIVTVLSVGLFFLITTGALGALLKAALVAVGAVIFVPLALLGTGRDTSYWEGYMDGRRHGYWW